MTGENENSKKQVTLVRSVKTERTADLEVLFSDDDGSAFYPHCILPPNFFDAALTRSGGPSRDSMLDGNAANIRELLSIKTWGGRDVMAIVSKG